MSRSVRALAAAAALVVPVLAARGAAAQMAHIPDNDWRQEDRHDAIQKAAEKPSFVFEVRFGTYLPNIDSEFSGGQAPFAKTFGTDFSAPSSTKPSVAPHFYFGFEFDALPVRIPYVGMFGLGVGWGFTQFSAQAINALQPTKQMTDASGASVDYPNPTGETTSLMIMPMHASLVLRVDELMRRTGIPIVPYGKAGAGFSFWRASTDAGTETCSGASSNAAAEASCATTRKGMGISPSLHFALGGMLSLNFIDPLSSARLGETTGVKHAYLFGEWYTDSVYLSGSALRVGASTWSAGLAVDM